MCAVLRSFFCVYLVTVSVVCVRVSTADAAKNGWSGLVGYYYHGRWAIQAKAVRSAVAANTTHLDFDAELGRFEEAWSRGSGLPFPSHTTGDTLALAEALLNKLAPTNNGTDGGVPHVDYIVYANTDAIVAHHGDPPVDMIQTWNTDVGVLRFYCDLDPSCAGFNTGGWLKNDTSHRGPSKANHDLWVKTVRV